MLRQNLLVNKITKTLSEAKNYCYELLMAYLAGKCALNKIIATENHKTGNARQLLLVTKLLQKFVARHKIDTNGMHHSWRTISRKMHTKNYCCKIIARHAQNKRKAQ